MLDFSPVIFHWIPEGSRFISSVYHGYLETLSSVTPSAPSALTTWFCISTGPFYMLFCLLVGGVVGNGALGSNIQSVQGRYTPKPKPDILSPLMWPWELIVIPTFYLNSSLLSTSPKACVLASWTWITPIPSAQSGVMFCASYQQQHHWSPKKAQLITSLHSMLLLFECNKGTCHVNYALLINISRQPIKNERGGGCVLKMQVLAPHGQTFLGSVLSSFTWSSATSTQTPREN